MENEPETFEEFMHSQDLTNWPALPRDEDEFQMNIQPDIFSSYEATEQYIREHVPFEMEVLDNIGQRIDQFVSRLDKYSSRILSDEPRKVKDNRFYVPSQAFLTQIQDSDALLTHPSRKLSEELFSARRGKTVEGEHFPGFKPLQFTELPGQLEAVQMLNWIRRAQNFNLGYQSTLKKLILSVPSAAILQDAFWWFFLSKFEPSQEDQDYLFSRIADSFVTLFMIAPPQVLDRFLEVYPSCLAQAVFAIFYKSYPESHYQFGDEFKSELIELFSLWITGLKPEPFSWKKWNLKWLEKSTSKRELDRKEKILHELESKSVRWKLDFEFDEVAKEDARTLDMKVGMTPKVSAAKAESSYAGRGPEFQHLLFRLSGRSPLVAHFINMKKIAGGSLSTTGPKTKHTEILKDPYPLRVSFFCNVKSLYYFILQSVNGKMTNLFIVETILIFYAVVV
ncbi:protein FAM227B-like [Mustelus asterias]